MLILCSVDSVERRPDRSTNRGNERYSEGSRVATLCWLLAMGFVLIVIGLVQGLEHGGRAWWLALLGVGIALVAGVILTLDPPGGRRR